MKYLALIAILACTGCSVTSSIIDGHCTANDRAKLSGLKVGASMVKPAPEAQRQIDALEAECGK